MKWYNIAALAVVIFLLCVGFASLASAQQQMKCAKTMDMLNEMLEKYQEVPVWHGETRQGVVLLTMSEKGTWTLLGSRDIYLCMIMSGIDAGFAPKMEAKPKGQDT